jgi:signal transduction histidine kinase
MVDIDVPRSVDELWLEALQRVSARAAHEVKGALNGVSVNLEVVRARALRPDAPASAVASFAESASGQLEQLSAMAEGMLSLGRAPREPVEVGTTLKQLAAVLEPAAKSEGGELCVESPRTAGAVRATGNVVRLVLATALLAALERKVAVRCTTELHDDAVVRISCADGVALRLPDEVADVATRAAIRIETDGHSISLAFPRVGRRAHETA